MWRPFLSSISDHTYDNFVKKYIRTESAPLHATRKTEEKYESTSFSNDRSWSIEAEKRVQEYKKLKERVKQQRQIIKENESNIQQIRNFKVTKMKNLKLAEKEKRKQELQRIRNFSGNKAKKYQILDLKPKFNPKKSIEPIFLQTSPLKMNTYRPRISSSPNKKRLMTIRNYQDRIMKDLKSKVPTYYKELKTEFIKIREHNEMTFEQYKDSKRLRRTSPYNIRTKRNNS